MFELKERDGLARRCILKTPHGNIETPTLLPVINPNQLLIKPGEMKDKFGTQAVITNSYIINKNEDLRNKALKTGVHSLLDFNGPIMTDSGTFQSHIYGDVEVDPLEIVTFQREIGSDIGTILDVFSEPDDNLEKVQQDLKITFERAESSTKIKKNMLLAGTIQGGRFKELRKQSAETMSAMDFDLYPIGGVVPIMESQRYDTLVDVILSSKQGLNPGKPVHLFGCGHPMVFSLAALLGCDLFDSSAYAKYAKESRMMFTDGTRFVSNLTDLPCECPVCSSHSVDELEGSPGKEKLIAEHNLHVSFGELRRIKQAISEGRLWELVEMRCRSHPSLMEGLKRVLEYRNYLERYEPLSRPFAFLHTSAESYYRPTVSRFMNRLRERYVQPDSHIYVTFPDGTKPYHEYLESKMKKILEVADAHFWVDSYFGPVPIELDEMYPIAQSVIPKTLEPEVKDKKFTSLKKAAESYFTGQGFYWEGNETIDNLKLVSSNPGTLDLDIMRVRAVADMQFGLGAADILFDGEIRLIKSKNTGKIRNVLVDDIHVLSMRANDGLFTLKFPGAEKLHAGFPGPALRVVVDNETAVYNKEGKSVFAKFILDADKDIIPGDEVLVVNTNDELVAVGRTIMTADEMRSFTSGMGVKVREGQSGQNSQPD